MRALQAPTPPTRDGFLPRLQAQRVIALTAALWGLDGPAADAPARSPRQGLRGRQLRAGRHLQLRLSS